MLSAAANRIQLVRRRRVAQPPLKVRVRRVEDVDDEDRAVQLSVMLDRVDDRVVKSNHAAWFPFVCAVAHVQERVMWFGNLPKARAVWPPQSVIGDPRSISHGNFLQEITLGPQKCF